MNVQFLSTPDGGRLAVAEDAADRQALAEFRRRLAAGEEELIPAAIVDRLLSGESRVRVWREHRGLSATSLAERAGLSQGFLSQIETGKREGTVETFRRIADALNVGLDDLVG